MTLVGFSKSEYIRELINQVDLGEIKFSNEAIDVLFESLKGHPRYTIGVCDKAFSEAVSSQKNNISASKILRIIKSLEKEIKASEISYKLN